MKKIIGLITLVFFSKFAGKRMTMADGTLFIPPKILVRVRVPTSKKKEQHFGWTYGDHAIQEIPAVHRTRTIREAFRLGKGGSWGIRCVPRGKKSLI